MPGFLPPVAVAIEVKRTKVAEDEATQTVVGLDAKLEAAQQEVEAAKNQQAAIQSELESVKDQKLGAVDEQEGVGYLVETFTVALQRKQASVEEIDRMLRSLEEDVRRQGKLVSAAASTVLSIGAEREAAVVGLELAKQAHNTAVERAKLPIPKREASADKEVQGKLPEASPRTANKKPSKMEARKERRRSRSRSRLRQRSHSRSREKRRSRSRSRVRRRSGAARSRSRDVRRRISRSRSRHRRSAKSSRSRSRDRRAARSSRRSPARRPERRRSHSRGRRRSSTRSRSPGRRESQRPEAGKRSRKRLRSCCQSSPADRIAKNTKREPKAKEDAEEKKVDTTNTCKSSGADGNTIVEQPAQTASGGEDHQDAKSDRPLSQPGSAAVPMSQSEGAIAPENSEKKASESGSSREPSLETGGSLPGATGTAAAEKFSAEKSSASEASAELALPPPPKMAYYAKSPAPSGGSSSSSGRVRRKTRERSFSSGPRSKARGAKITVSKEVRELFESALDRALRRRSPPIPISAVNDVMRAVNPKFAVFPDTGMQFHTLAQAMHDEGLFEASRTGRNMVILGSRRLGITPVSSPDPPRRRASPPMHARGHNEYVHKARWRPKSHERRRSASPRRRKRSEPRQDSPSGKGDGGRWEMEDAGGDRWALA